MENQGTKHAIRITLIYFTLSVGWIFFSDRLLQNLITDNQYTLQAQTYKGWFFVLVTSILLFYLIRKSTSSLTERKKETEAALQENQQLLSELHHRVKNNLALISSLIQLQADSLDKPETTALFQTQYRIFALAEIEELFYQNKDISRVPFHTYIEALTANLDESDTNNTSFKVHAEHLLLTLEQAIRLGLLFNEIVTLLRINGSDGPDQEIAVNLVCPTSEKVVLEITFEDVDASTLSPLQEEGCIEHTFMKLYKQQLNSFATWQQQNGVITFKLTFNKEDSI